MHCLLLDGIAYMLLSFLFIIGGLPYMSPALFFFLIVALIFLAFASAGIHLIRALSTFGLVALI